MKVLFIVSLIVSILATTSCSICNNSNAPEKENGTFSLEDTNHDFQWAIENCPSDKNVGSVSDANTAITKAKELWIAKYLSDFYNPIDGREILVSYDSKNECWWVRGTLPGDGDGEVPMALIKTDGTVLAIWIG